MVSAPAPVSQNLQASASTVTVGQSFSATDVLTVNSSTTSQARPLFALISPLPALARSKPKPKGQHRANRQGPLRKQRQGAGRATVKVIGGVAEAKAKLKLKTPGLQTLTAVS